MAKMKRTQATIIKELYDQGSSPREICEKTNFPKKTIYAKLNIFDHGFNSPKEYRQFHAENPEFKTYWMKTRNSKQNEFETKINLLSERKIDKHNLDMGNRLKEEVEFLLDKLEKNYPNGSRLREIIEKRYFDNKTLKLIGLEEGCANARILTLEKTALKRLNIIAKEYYTQK